MFKNAYKIKNYQLTLPYKEFVKMSMKYSKTH